MIALFPRFVASVTVKRAGRRRRRLEERIDCFPPGPGQKAEPERSHSPVSCFIWKAFLCVFTTGWSLGLPPHSKYFQPLWEVAALPQELTPWLGWEAGWHWQALRHSIPVLCSPPCLALKSVGTRENCEPEVLRFLVKWVFLWQPFMLECSVVSNFLVTHLNQ